MVLTVQFCSCVSEPCLQVSNRNLTQKEINQNVNNFIQKLNISKGDTIVDIGCGNASMDFNIFKLQPNTYFILEDIKKKKISNDFVIIEDGSKKYFKNNYKFVLGESESIPLGTNSYKKILFSSVLHELEEPSKMIDEICRIMRKDASLIVIEPIQSNKKDRLSCKKNFLKKEKIIEIVTLNNFELIRSDSTNNTKPHTRAMEYYILTFAKKS